MLASLGWMLLASLPLSGLPSVPTDSPDFRSRHPLGAAGRITLWTDRDEPYRRGEPARVYLSTDEPSYVTVLRVDTDGRLRVIFPHDPWDDTFVPESRTLEVAGSRRGGTFLVDDYPGVGYLFALASSQPFDYDDIARGDYWDYRLIGGGRVRGDPYVALTDMAERIAPDGDYDYDIVPYYVDRRYDYPRFVCYDCHTYAGYDEWDPYRTRCSRFRLVIYDDPRYYPYRYGRNTVINRPTHPGPRYVFRDRDPASDYVTRLPRRSSMEDRRPADRERTSEDVGGPGIVPAPRISPFGRRAIPRVPELPPARPRVEGRRRADERRRAEPPREDRQADTAEPRGLAPPRSTGEPELRRRRRP